ncbi:hypothetical protein [Haladaptatus sp. DYF46]|uniref:hypothetical protein n=1 Tax=Haladaptatus sp. DYF46 TaxID=2886041 RepID=UPI001E36D107|nr:hypothetical protein [Haladaptatus sp. DYF46]
MRDVELNERACALDIRAPPLAAGVSPRHALGDFSIRPEEQTAWDRDLSPSVIHVVANLDDQLVWGGDLFAVCVPDLRARQQDDFRR